MDNLVELKEEYNLLVEEYKKAEAYFDSNDYSIEEKEKYIPKAQNLFRDMSKILNLFDKHGIKYTNDEALEGFKI